MRTTECPSDSTANLFVNLIVIVRRTYCIWCYLPIYYLYLSVSWVLSLESKNLTLSALPWVGRGTWKLSCFSLFESLFPFHITCIYEMPTVYSALWETRIQKARQLGNSPRYHEIKCEGRWGGHRFWVNSGKRGPLWGGALVLLRAKALPAKEPRTKKKLLESFCSFFLLRSCRNLSVAGC